MTGGAVGSVLAQLLHTTADERKTLYPVLDQEECLVGVLTRGTLLRAHTSSSALPISEALVKGHIGRASPKTHCARLRNASQSARSDARQSSTAMRPIVCSVSSRSRISCMRVCATFRRSVSASECCVPDPYASAIFRQRRARHEPRLVRHTLGAHSRDGVLHRRTDYAVPRCALLRMRSSSAHTRSYGSGCTSQTDTHSRAPTLRRRFGSLTVSRASLVEVRPPP